MKEKQEELWNVKNLGGIKDSYLMDPDNILQYNSQILYQLAELVRANFNEIRIDRKFTVTNKKVLAGITLDWRHMDTGRYLGQIPNHN